MNLSSLWSSFMLQFQLADKFTYIQGKKDQPTENISASSSLPWVRQLYQNAKCQSHTGLTCSSLASSQSLLSALCKVTIALQLNQAGDNKRRMSCWFNGMTQGTYLTEWFPGFGEWGETAVTSADLKEMGRDERNSIEIKILNGIAKVCIFSRLCF